MVTRPGAHHRTVVTPHGIALDAGADSGPGAIIAPAQDPAWDFGGGPFAVLCIFRLTDAIASGQERQILSSSNLSNHMAVYVRSNSSAYTLRASCGLTSSTDYPIGLGDTIAVAVGRDVSGGTRLHYRNLRTGATGMRTGSNAGAWYLRVAGADLRVLGHTGAGFPGQIFGVAMRRSALPDYDALLGNPWSVFRPRRRVAFFGLGAGGIHAGTCGAAKVSGVAALSAQVALAGIGVALAEGQAGANVALPLSAAGIAIADGDACARATVTIAAIALAEAAGAAGLSAAVLSEAAGAAAASGHTDLAALLHAQAIGVAQTGGSADLRGGAHGSLTALGSATPSGQAALSVTVWLNASDSSEAGGAATGSPPAPDALSAAGSGESSGSAIWSVTKTMTAAGFVQAMAAGSIDILINLEANGSSESSGSAVVLAMVIDDQPQAVCSYPTLGMRLARQLSGERERISAGLARAFSIGLL